MRRIVGLAHTAHVTKSSRLSGQFNAHLATALLVHLEEASWGGDREAKGVLQSLITAPQMPLEKKGVDVVQVDSFCRLLMTANDEWVVPATEDERRYCVLEIPSHRQGDRAYWSNLYRQIEGDGTAGFLAHLREWVVPEGVDVRQPPQTAGLAGQKLATLRGVDRWWFTCCLLVT
ncbi:MAG: primase-helicase family protein [Paracoccaceae bacterium]